jgi:hypothetical protein
MKDGRIIADHLDKINEQCRAAFKQKEAIDRRLRFIEGIVAAAGVLHISH